MGHPHPNTPTMPANRASKGRRETGNRNRNCSDKNSSARAPNRRQMRRMQANGISSSRKPRRPEAEEAGGKGHGAAAQEEDALSNGEDYSGIKIKAQQMP